MVPLSTITTPVPTPLRSMARCSASSSPASLVVHQADHAHHRRQDGLVGLGRGRRAAAPSRATAHGGVDVVLRDDALARAQHQNHQQHGQRGHQRRPGASSGVARPRRAGPGQARAPTGRGGLRGGQAGAGRLPRRAQPAAGGWRRRDRL
jgi:hypothetical protein